MTGRILLLFIMAALSPAESATAQHANLDRHISETLQHPKYSWVFQAKRQDSANRQSWGPLQTIRQSLDRVGNATHRALRSFLGWLDGVLSPSKDRPAKTEPSGKAHVSLWVLGVFAAIAILAALFLMLRRRPRALAVRAASQSAAITRIEDEQTLATALPEREWLQLAADYREQGEGRLAVRALHLAGLAMLKERGIVTISAFKTSADYRADLLRRGRSAIMSELFARNNLRYESTWYGAHEVSHELMESFHLDLESLRKHAHA